MVGRCRAGILTPAGVAEDILYIPPRIPGKGNQLSAFVAGLGINRAMIEKYFPLLEMTDLVRHLDKFTKSAVKVRPR